MPRRHLAQFACEKEATPGVAETLVAADVLVRLRSGYVIEPETEQIPTEEIDDVEQPRADIFSTSLQRFTTAFLLKGPGDLVTAPANADMLEASLLAGEAAKTIAIGAVTGGPYVAGETITGGTSGATGQVLKQTADGAASIPFRPLTGTFSSGEVLTGGTSGATATSSGTPADGGYVFRTVSWDDDGSAHHTTCGGFVDGFQWTGRGMLSDLQVELTRAGPAIVTQSWLGARESDGDGALFTVDPYPENSVVTPKFLSAGILVDTQSLTDKGVAGITINRALELEPKGDAGSTRSDGILYTDYTLGDLIINFQVDQTPSATYDYFATMRAGTQIPLEFGHGLSGAAGTRWDFVFPAVQIQGDLRPGELNGRATFDARFKAVGDPAMIIWQH